MKGDMMKITWHGHSAFEIDGSNKTFIDPFLSRNRMAKIRWEDVKPDVIAVTHGHGDHFGDTVNIARSTGCKIIAISEIADYLFTKGLNVIDMNIGGTVDLGVRYSMVPAVHSSSIDDKGMRNAVGIAVGFVIRDGPTTIYHAGDTALFSDMSLIHDLYHPDVAMLPIGGCFTMDANAAVLAVKMIKPRIVLPMHYNTFDNIMADPGQFKRAVEEQTDTKVILLESGESIEI